jgi:hypothetical protein
MIAYGGFSVSGLTAEPRLVGKPARSKVNSAFIVEHLKFNLARAPSPDIASHIIYAMRVIEE